MNLLPPTWVVACAVLLGGLVLPLTQAFSQAQGGSLATNDIWLEVIKGTVRISETGSGPGIPTQVSQMLKPSYLVRTETNSFAEIRWSSGSRLSLGPAAEILVREHPPGEETGFHIFKGLLKFLHRDSPGLIHFTTPGTDAGVDGTEFVIEVDDQQRTRVWVIEGKVGFTNQFGNLSITDDQGLLAEPGKPPVRSPGFNANNILQWCFYYPAVLDLQELPLTGDEQQALNQSLTAYRQGDLLQALQQYPDGRVPQSDGEKLYYAALILSVGEVARADELLGSLPVGNGTDRMPRLAGALRQLIAAVKRQDFVAAVEPETATELLAASYYQQSLAVKETSLREALKLARSAKAKSPEFGFAWARIAELEFSFGHTKDAVDALSTALVLGPRNAEAISLQGFLLAAQNKTRGAIDVFNQAIEVDPGLGNAWLGRGLCRIRRGDRLGGREDLLTAAALEPQRAALRSYLGKAYGNDGDFPRASRELDLAKRLDPQDPTSWLYSALLKQQQNRINEAIADLEKSEDLNDNRSVYRSQMLLDQDRAVRSANLAGIYRDAGMFDVSVREAGRAVNYDYANYSAHLFLANSYIELRDQNLINLRYETATESEFLLANLLSPASAGTLSSTLSQSEYSRLFDRNGFGLYSGTLYLSRGAWAQEGSQYGNFGNFSYNFDAYYRWDPGDIPHADFERTDLSFQAKQQLTASDMVYGAVSYHSIDAGDVAQHYDPASANPGLTTNDKQEPLALIGYHHEWNPGLHTLFLAGYVNEHFSVQNSNTYTLLMGVDGKTIGGISPLFSVQNYESKADIYSAEVQQIWQTEKHDTVIGARLQYGHFRNSNLQKSPSDFVGSFTNPMVSQEFSTPFDRESVYGYHTWRVIDPVDLTAGVTYDRLHFPQNFQYAPISDAELSKDQVSPKAGLIWRAAEDTVLRGAYTKSLGGVSTDQSLRIEPSQVAGFNQSYRSIIPESVAGSSTGERFETFDGSIEQKFPTHTYVALTGEILNSKATRELGAFALDLNVSDTAFPSGTEQSLDFREKSLTFSVHQLLGQGFALGTIYRVSDADLQDDFTQVPASAFLGTGFSPHTHIKATLHQLETHIVYNHPSGVFAQFQTLWNLQQNRGYSPSLENDDFWHFNFLAGYRLPGRRAEITFAVLNLTGQDYRLNPLSYYTELPRKRTFAVQLKFDF